MSARPFYETVYHCNDWQIADAFRPQPGWGSRRFTTPTAVFGDATHEQILEGAKEAAPEGYRLTKLSIYADGMPEHIIWSTPPDARFTAPSIGRSSNRGDGG